MRSKAYKAILYIAKILLWAILLGAAALTIWVMTYFKWFAVAAISAAVLIDLVIRYDAWLSKKRGGIGHDSSRDEP